jgi:hypothetical protein
MTTTDTTSDYLTPSIHLHKTRFASGIRATFDGESLYVPEPALDDLGRPFTGPGSPEIDAAWHDLIYGRYVRFTDAEKSWLNADDGIPHLTPLQPTYNSTFIPEEGFYGAPDMLHSLHCVNALRKHLEPGDYYSSQMSPVQMKYARMHLDHCLEQLRQAVLCHGDLTPVTLKPLKHEDGRIWGYLGETEREHMCRNGEELGVIWVGRGEKTARVEAD